MNTFSNEGKSYRGTWLVTIPLVAIAIVHLVFVFLPGHRAIAKLQKDIESRQRYINDADNVSHQLANEQQELVAIESYINDWKKVASTVNRLPVLYGQINKLSKEAGTTTTRFEPQMIVELGLIRQIPINIACTGTFAQIHEFIRLLESMPLTIWIESLDLDKTGRDGGNISCEIKLVVFSDNPTNSNYVENNN